jgi:alpha-mannosidase
MSKSAQQLDLDIRIMNADRKKLYKLSVPYAMQNVSAFAEVAFGEEPFRLQEDENVHQKYVRLEGDENQEIHVYNKGIYSSSLGDNRLLVSLMRSPSYCAHPIGDTEILPQNRTSPYIEQGEREFSLRFAFGKRDISCGIEAQIYNEKPVCLSFFPAGEDTAEKRSFLRLDGGKIVLVALKKAEKENAYVLRLFNPTADSAVCRLESHILGIDQTIAFSAFEVKTFRLSEGTLTEWELMEGMTD